MAFIMIVKWRLALNPGHQGEAVTAAMTGQQGGSRAWVWPSHGLAGAGGHHAAPHCATSSPQHCTHHVRRTQHVHEGQPTASVYFFRKSR